MYNDTGFFWRWQRHHVYVQWKILALRYVNLVVHRHFPFLFHFPFITLNISLTQICNKINVYDKKKFAGTSYCLKHVPAHSFLMRLWQVLLKADMNS